MTLKVGSKVNDKYEILKVINSGGMSTVYIALDIRLNKNWAIKEILKKNSRKSEVEYKSLLTEINILKNLDHVYLPRIVDILENSERIFVVMDYIEGKTLYDIVSNEGSLPQDRVVRWGKQLATALGYLHSQNPPIIYRDMKPENIMLQPNGNIKLFDFGASRTFEGEESWKTTPLGTKGYAAPERLKGSIDFGVFDVRSDIYELGMTLYHLLTGHDPRSKKYPIKKITEWNPTLNKGLEKIIDKMTAYDPNNRYQSTEELMYDLNNYQELDIDYRKKLLTKLKTVVITGVSSLIMFAFSGVGYYANAVTVTNSYEDKLQQASQQSDPTLAIEATHIKDDDLEAYNLMINIFKQDDVFTNVEEAEFLGSLTPNLSKLEGKEGYGDFAYNISKLYFYYGDNAEKAMRWAKSSLRSDPSNRAQVNNLYKLASFQMNLENGKIDKSLKEYWGILSKSIYNLDDASMVNLKNISLVYSLIDKHGSELRKTGVNLSQVSNVLDKIDSYLSSVQTHTKTGKQLKMKLSKSEGAIVQKAVKAFK